MKFSGKWMDLEKNQFNCGNPDTEKQIWYASTYMWILAVRSMITKL